MDNPKSTGCRWVTKTVKGTPPASRQGHSLAVVGKTAYIFGGSSCNAYEDEDEEHNSAPVYFNDLFSLKLIDQHVSWDRVKQTGDIPSPRDGLTMCCVGSSLYLFGGTDNPEGDTPLEGLYCFDTGSQKWESCLVQGIQPNTLGHSAATIENSVYVFGGICKGVAKNSMLMLNIDNLTWTPLFTSGNPPAPRCDHGCTVVGETFYIMGGTGGEQVWFNDIYCFDTATLQWRRILSEGVPPHPRCFHTFTAHHKKDIYLFGGCNDSMEKKSVVSDLYKFSIASAKWKKPNASGTPPEKRFGHTACIIYGQLIIFGGMNYQTDFNDICILQTRAANKYLNRTQAGSPTDSLLASLGYSTSEGPNLRFDIKNAMAATYKLVLPNRPSKTTEVDLGDAKQEVTGKLEEIFEHIKVKFDQLEMEKETLRNAVEAFKEERMLYMEQYDNQQKEFRVMVENHKVQMEGWVKKECEQVDQEKRKLAIERVELAEQQKLLLENSKRLEAIRKVGSIIVEGR